MTWRDLNVVSSLDQKPVMVEAEVRLTLLKGLEERGMVIETFYDGKPDTKKFLLDWEDGQYGPIIS